MPAAAAIRVLVVDDQMTIRSLVRAGLNTLGMTQIAEAADGEDALRVLLTQKIHLVISDYNMPKLDGLGLLRAVRAQESLKSTGFIMLTGRADQELVQRAVQYGVNNYLVKPFTVATLKEKIEGVFGTPDMSQTTLLERKIHVIQGERHATADPSVMLTTILGSCVSACLRDPVAGVGGMNHFLLPGEDRSDADGARFGAYAMELLINDLLALGADRRRLEGKLFGGGRMLRGLSDVGTINAAFAERYLEREGIALVGGSLRGDEGRRIQYWPVSGRARQTMIDPRETDVFVAERQVPRNLPVTPCGDLELFDVFGLERCRTDSKRPDGPDLLRAVAVELRDIVRDCHDLEEAIGEVFQILPQGDLLRRMQALDLIIQRTVGLAGVTDRLADEAVATVVSDRVLADVSLSDMARRLSGTFDGKAAPAGDAEFW